MNEMVERVADAIDNAFAMRVYDREDLREMARAAIKAMREPIDAMTKAIEEPRIALHPAQRDYLDSHTGAMAYQAMIDEALR